MKRTDDTSDGGLGTRLAAWKPSAITGGQPFFPLFVLFGLNAVDELDRSAFNVLVPNIRDHFRLDIQGILTVVSLVSLAVILLQVPISFYADRMSRVRIATAGGAVWGIFSIATGLAPNIWWLGVARAGSGIGVAVNAPTHNSLLADYYDVSVRPKVYGFHRAANSIGQFIGPLLAGLLAFQFGWRAPFIVYGIPTIAFVLLALRLRDPKRGTYERLAGGASDETAETEESPPSFAESWRILWQVRTLRWIWYSLPFLASAFIGFGALLSVYYEQIFGLDEVQRGTIFALAEPAQLIGLLVAVPIANRLMARDPGAGIRFLTFALLATSVSWVIIVVSPNLILSVAGQIAVAAMFAVIGPGVTAALSLAIPPRVRSMGFTVGALWYIPGVLLLTIIGGIADEYGVRRGIALMIPVLLVGAAIIGYAARFMASDIHRVRTSSIALAEVTAARNRGEIKLLLVKSLDVGYDNVQVLFGIDFEVDEGEIIALLGTNGAGKSTLLKAISGLVEAQGGAVVFEGRDMTYAPPHEVVSRGVIQVPGGRGVFPSLSVAENLKIAGWLYRGDAGYTKDATERVLGYFPVLRERWDQPAGNLSGGEQQMLTLGMAFIAKPRLLMIDELSLGLAPVIVEQLLQIVKAIRERGTTIILVEQSVNVALTVAETAYFLEKGEIRFRGPTAELLQRPDVLRSVFLEGAASVSGPRAEAAGDGGGDGDGDGRGDGSDAPRAAILAEHAAGIDTRLARAEAGDPSGVVMEVRALHKGFGGVIAVDEVDFELHDGQILGIIGPNGAGKTTVFDLLSGFLIPDRGRVSFLGRDITNLGPDARARLGLGRSFQDARLFPALTVKETIALALERSLEVRDPIAAALNLPAVATAEQRVDERVENLIELMGLEAFRDKFISELSTGSRRIVDLACVLAHEPRVILFDEPSSGIAQRETEALGPLLRRIRDATGSSLLVIEHDMPLITSISDEMVALDLGRVLTRGTPTQVVNHPQVVASYLGSTEEVIARSGALQTAGSKPSGRKPRKSNGARKGNGAGRSRATTSETGAATRKKRPAPRQRASTRRS